MVKQGRIIFSVFETTNTEKEVNDFLEAISHSEFVEIKDAAHMVAGDRNDIFAAAAIEFLVNHTPLKEN